MLTINLGHHRCRLAPPWDGVVLLAMLVGPPGLAWCLWQVWTQ